MSIVVIFLSKMVCNKKCKGPDLVAKPPLGNAMGMGLVHRRVPPSSKWSVSIYQTLDEKRQIKWFVVSCLRRQRVDKT